MGFFMFVCLFLKYEPKLVFSRENIVFLLETPFGTFWVTDQRCLELEGIAVVSSACIIQILVFTHVKALLKRQITKIAPWAF